LTWPYIDAVNLSPKLHVSVGTTVADRTALSELLPGVTQCTEHSQPYTNVKLSNSNQSHCQHLKVFAAVANANVRRLHAAISAESKSFTASKPVT